jgi:hypothetical protein
MRPNILKFETHRDLTLERLHELAVDHATKTFYTGVEQVEPIWVVYENPHLVWLETAWENQRQKEGVVDIMRDALRRKNMHAYSFISEAYVSVSKADEPIRPPSLRPRDQRDEVLMVWSFGRAGGVLTSRFLVTPRRTGPRILGPRDDTMLGGTGDNTGLLWNLFEKEKPVLYDNETNGGRGRLWETGQPEDPE